MDKNEKTKADQHDHNDHLPKDVLNAEQDPDSFRDPLEQQLEKQQTSNAADLTQNKEIKPDK